MSARLLITCCLTATAALAPAAVADAAKKRAPYPTVSKVAPLKLRVGDKLTITGKNFIKGKRKNTVVFKRDGKRAVFVKANGVSSKKLTLVIPESLRSHVASKAGRTVPTRFRIRVLARRFAKGYTSLKLSPTISAPAASPATPPPAPTPGATILPVAKSTAQAAAAGGGAPTAPVAPADCDQDGIPNTSDPDDDNDILSDAFEATLKTNACLPDTDGDAMEDGWEYQSAIDFNRESCHAVEYPTPCPGAKPYPHSTPYPNPLIQDSNKDYDGDWLPAWFEHHAWQRKNQRADLANLWYSDGLQSSRDTNDGDSCRGLREAPVTGQVDQYPTGVTTTSTGGASTPRYAFPYGRADYSLDWDEPGHPNDGCLNDAERDEDGDFLGNEVELTGPLSGPEFAKGIYREPLFQNAYEGTDPLDADSDGDGLVDGLDDQDNDDFWNIEEMARGDQSTRGPREGETLPPGVTAVDTGLRGGLWTDAFNPCLPAKFSRSCPRLIPLTGDIWRPFYDVRGNAEPPAERWPMYRDKHFDGEGSGVELWNAMPQADQILPPRQPNAPGPGAQHPLPRPTYTPAP